MNEIMKVLLQVASIGILSATTGYFMRELGYSACFGMVAFMGFAPVIVGFIFPNQALYYAITSNVSCALGMAISNVLAAFRYGYAPADLLTVEAVTAYTGPFVIGLALCPLGIYGRFIRTK